MPVGRSFGFNDSVVWGGVLPDNVQCERTGKYLELRGAYPFFYHHQGEDFALVEGTPLLSPYASAVGYLTREGDGNSLTEIYGNSVWLNFEGGGSLFAAHQSRIDVAIGDILTEGQQFGLSGNTGRSTGPHVHIQCNTSTTDTLLIEAIDPLAFLTLLAARASGATPPPVVITPKEELVEIATQARLDIPSRILAAKLDHVIARL